MEAEIVRPIRRKGHARCLEKGRFRRQGDEVTLTVRRGTVPRRKVFYSDRDAVPKARVGQWLDERRSIMSKVEETATLTRSDFLRLVAVGAGGLGLTALAGCGSKTVVHEEGRQGYVVAVTHGAKDPTRVMLALVTASKLPKGDNHVWFAIDGGELCKKGEAERVASPLFAKQENAAKMIELVRSQGTALHI